MFDYFVDASHCKGKCLLKEIVIKNNLHCAKMKFSINSVNMNKSAENCGFGHIYWRNP